MTDKYGNAVDGEIYVPVEGFIQYTSVRHAPKPQTETAVEYTIAFADGTTGNEGVYRHEGDARLRLHVLRRELAIYRIPEEYWPILMKRTVVTTFESWEHLSV